jgi:quercetin dioxygenase-like cupin family protein
MFRGLMMKDFPDFMKNSKNRIDCKDQYTLDVEGYFFEGGGGSQMAFWTCHADRVSESHTHDFDEYLVCVYGKYTVLIDGKEVALYPGDEFFIPKGALHGGRCIAGTRTINAFGGRRIQKTP